MAEGRTKIEGNENMENYPDSLNSSPRSRDTDPECFGGGNQRWDAVDPAGGSGGRVRLMCSCGGKIHPRPHDNQLTYVGGDTRILAVDRNIRFPAMVAKLAGLWGMPVSFKYQLPNEDLDALVSVTNEEDLENMMAEYDRLLKSGYKFSRLRLFAFPLRQAEAGSAASSLGSSVMEDSGRREQWFVEALNTHSHPPVSQAPGSAPAETSAWVNNMPDYLFGLENSNGANVGDEDPKQKQKQQQVIENADARVGGLENSNRGYEEGNRPGAVQEVARPSADRVPNVSYQDANPNPRVQVPPVQELQKMQIKQPPPPPPDPAPVPVPVPVPRQEESVRKVYSDPVRVPGGGTDAPRSGPEPAYQNPPPDYYAQDLQQQQQQQLPAHGHFNPQPVTYYQMHDHAGAGMYLVPAGSPMMPAMASGRPAAGYYNPPVMPRMNLPQPVYEACPPVPTVRPMGVVQRQTPAEVPDQYRDAPPPPPQPVVAGPKMPAVYGMPPGVGPVPPMMYRATTPVQVAAGHQQEAYSYAQQHMVYEPNPPRQVYYTQALNPPYQAVGPVTADLHASPPEMTGSSPEQQQQGKLTRV